MEQLYALALAFCIMDPSTLIAECEDYWTSRKVELVPCHRLGVNLVVDLLTRDGAVLVAKYRCCPLEPGRNCLTVIGHRWSDGSVTFTGEDTR